MDGGSLDARGGRLPQRETGEPLARDVRSTPTHIAENRAPQFIATTSVSVIRAGPSWHDGSDRLVTGDGTSN
jgi:hypothetical protein